MTALEHESKFGRPLGLGIGLCLLSALCAFGSRFIRAWLPADLVAPHWVTWAMFAAGAVFSLSAAITFCVAWCRCAVAHSGGRGILVGAALVAIVLTMLNGFFLGTSMVFRHTDSIVRSPSGRREMCVTWDSLMFAGAGKFLCHTARSGSFLHEQLFVFLVLDDDRPTAIRWSPSEDQFGLYYIEYGQPTDTVYLHNAYDFATGVAIQLGNPKHFATSSTNPVDVLEMAQLASWSKLLNASGSVEMPFELQQ